MGISAFNEILTVPGFPYALYQSPMKYTEVYG